MEASMGPPLPPGYSLRVMLFKANACNLGDKPIRCFRVVSSPDVTVRDFCQEASRIHEINYGEPIAIKKVQDDQEFDITQGELLGSLFKNLDTIRVIQASCHPSIRDSLPPTSALRFEPGTSRKRERSGSVQPSGSVPNSWNPNKRQRVVQVDPDHPLPSREVGASGRRSSINMILDSQDSTTLRSSNGHVEARHVREAPGGIPGTPSPPPTSRRTATENGFADHRDVQSDIQSSHEDLNLPVHSTAFRESSVRVQSQVANSPRAKSASYHIPQLNERGASVSTAATSPQSIDQQTPTHNEDISAKKHMTHEPLLPPHNGRFSRSPNEQSIYENITSDDEGSATSKAKKATLKQKRSPGAGLPGLEWMSKKFNTPPNGSRRSSGSRESATTPGELPLTPSSKEREEKRLRETANARKAGIAAVEAAERRKREADEARIMAEREKREDQERLDVEEFNRGEAERKAAIARTARREKREAREKKSAEELKRRDELQKQKAAEAERLKKVQEEAERTRLPSSSPDVARPPKSSSPTLPRGTPNSRGHSGTPFIPGSVRKSALKNSMSSQAMRSSSPAPSHTPEIPSTTSVGIESQMPLPKANRRVSFQKEVTETRILPPSKTYATTAVTPKKPAIKTVAKIPLVHSPAILPPSRQSAEGSATPITASQVAPPAKLIPTPKGPSPLAVAKKVSSPVSQPRKKESPVLPPSSQPKKVSPPASQHSKSWTPVVPPASKAKSKSNSAEPLKSKHLPPRPVETSSEDPDSDEEMVDTPNPEVKSASPLGKVVPAKVRAEDPESSDEEDGAGDQEADEDETQSQDSSNQDNRPQVSFIQHSKADEPSKFTRTTSDSSSDDDEDEDEDEEMKDAIDEEKPMVEEYIQTSIEKPEKEEKSELESEELESEDDDETEVQVPKSSPPTLPVHKSPAKPMNSKLNLAKNSKDSPPDDGFNTQDQIDQQLTSSMLEVSSSIPTSTPNPVPASSATTRPPPIKFGASLSSLNQNRHALTTSSQTKPIATRNGQLQAKLALTQDDEDSESSESESSDSSSSDDDDNGDDGAPKSKQSALPLTSGPMRKSESSKVDSDSDESDEDEEEAVKRKARDQLAATVAAMDTSSQKSAVFPSPKPYSTQQAATPQKKEKKPDKYTFGYSFKQVGL